MTSPTLPTAFADLQPFADWALQTADARQFKRLSSSREALRAFYDATLPHLEEILTLCDQHTLGSLPAELQPLYNMALSMAEVAPHIELYGGAPGVPYAFAEQRFVAGHGNDETWRGENAGGRR